MPGAAASPAAAGARAWHGPPDDTIAATIPVPGGEPAQVAVNSYTNTVYVTSGATSGVLVISGKTNKIVKTVSLGSGASGGDQKGVAVNAQTNRIYVALGTQVKVLSGRTNKVVATITGKGLYAQLLAVNPVTNTVYATNNLGAAFDAVSVINGSTNKVVATVPEPLLPEGIAVNPRTNRIYVTCGSK